MSLLDTPVHVTKLADGPAEVLGPQAVLDEEIQAELDRYDSVKLETKEAAVKHSRHWVRLTRLCNQRCIFCLDSWNHNGTYIDTEQLYQYIALGKALGRERLILSGGEPTIHPDYVKFIRHGRKVGYDWIQTVTNGMMFAYPEFTRKCIRAGLNEVTVSIHGHTPKIQDRLTGVKGAFDKGVQGIRNIRALSGGRTVVNVDVVINKQNIKHLRAILDFFRGMGIHEFDLLYIVPFGRGFAEYRRQLYFDLDAHAADLRSALEVSREPGVYIWTNRLPVQHLEDFEDLIQDPHKLHSEVMGGLHNFEGYMKLGVAPDCHGERCPHCFLKGLCHDHMFDYRTRLTDGAFEHVRIDLAEDVASDRAQQVIGYQKPQWLHVQAAGAEEVQAFLESEPYPRSEGMQTIAEARDTAGPAALLAARGVDRVVVSTPEALAAAVAVGPAGDGPDLECALDAAMVGWLTEPQHAKALAPWLTEGKLIGRLLNFEYMTEVNDNGVGLEAIAALRDMGVRLMNVAQCLGGPRSEADRHYELSRGMLDAKGDLGVTPYVQRYIMGEYYSKSLRCKECVLSETCKGMHINFLRVHGYKVLSPIASPKDAFEAAPAA